MFSSVKWCTEVQKNQRCRSNKISIYDDVIENFGEGNVTAVVSTETNLKNIKLPNIVKKRLNFWNTAFMFVNLNNDCLLAVLDCSVAKASSLKQSNQNA